MSYRPLLGIIRCAQKNGAQRMDAACLRALSVAGQSAPHPKSVEAIIKRRLDNASRKYHRLKHPPTLTSTCAHGSVGYETTTNESDPMKTRTGPARSWPKHRSGALVRAPEGDVHHRRSAVDALAEQGSLVGEPRAS